jgi:putative serine protease PepD
MAPEHRSLWSDGPSENDHHGWLDDEPTTEAPAAPPVDEAPTRPHRTTSRRAAAAPSEPSPRTLSRRRRLRNGVVALSAAALLVGGVAIGMQVVGTTTVERAVVSGSGSTPSADAIKAVWEATNEGVVRVTTSTGNGTGWVYDDTGLIVTNNHVVSGGRDIKVRFGDRGQDVSARLMGTDVSSDLAVLKIDPKDVDKLVPLELADSDKVQTADQVIAIGYPLGLDQTTTAGIISGVGRQIQAQNNFSIDKVIQTDAPINPGNSGGPLLDMKGRVVGVNSQIATTGMGGGSVGIGFAVPSNTVKQVVPTIAKGGSIQHAWLGVQMGKLTGVEGVAVGVVTPGGPAARAGMRSVSGQTRTGQEPDGDVIIAIDGKKVDQPDDISAIINGHKPGDVISLEVKRNGQRETLKVTLGNRPTSAAKSGGTTTTPTTPSDPTDPNGGGGGQTPNNPLNPGPDSQTPGQP